MAPAIPSSATASAAPPEINAAVTAELIASPGPVTMAPGAR